uniref:Uncharacterized protein n=1 Tax=Caenorhabditis japonica TaxID=281687 RepID=A0A8R1I7Y0_CAEJA
MRNSLFDWSELSAFYTEYIKEKYQENRVPARHPGPFRVRPQKKTRDPAVHDNSKQWNEIDINCGLTGQNDQNKSYNNKTNIIIDTQ